MVWERQEAVDMSSNGKIEKRVEYNFGQSTGLPDKGKEGGWFKMPTDETGFSSRETNEAYETTSGCG
uniref:Uncharacterized protein n=1 Tax=Nelumbo nucifera TaxID=4432 RepID=A0A822Z5M1_NELNU|nr:TPA_asm: hypothetical protein HUJ06_013067 [Nelumbo nucifera]